MNKFWKVTAIAAALLTVTPPALAKTAWTGTGIVRAVTTACKSGGPKVNSRLAITYAPGNVNADAHISFVSRPRAFQFFNGGGDFAAGNTITQVLVIKGSLDVIGIVQQPPAVKLVTWSQSPALVQPSDPYISLSAKIANFSGIKGCAVTFRSKLSRLD